MELLNGTCVFLYYTPGQQFLLTIPQIFLSGTMGPLVGNELCLKSPLKSYAATNMAFIQDTSLILVSLSLLRKKVYLRKCFVTIFCLARNLLQNHTSALCSK